VRIARSGIKKRRKERDKPGPVLLSKWIANRGFLRGAGGLRKLVLVQRQNPHCGPLLFNSSKSSERLVHSCHSSCVLVLTLMRPILSALP